MIRPPLLIVCALPPLVAVAVSAAIVVTAAAGGSPPFWRGGPLTLSEAAALRDQGEVARLTLSGSDPNAPNSSAVVREAVKERIREFLLPVNEEGSGWSLRKTVLRLELEAEVARVEGVALVNQLFLASGDGPEVDSVAMTGIQLPRLDGIEVAVDTDPLSLDQLRGTAITPTTTTTGAKKLVPIPVIPEEC